MALPQESFDTEMGTVVYPYNISEPVHSFQLMPQVEITILDNSEVGSSITAMNQIENASVPMTDPGSVQQPSVLVFPTEGGGRGPSYNSGDEITTDQLTYLLMGSLDFQHFNANVINHLNGIESDIQSNTDSIGSLSNDISNLSNNVDYTNTRVDNLESQIVDYNDNFITINNNISIHDDQIQRLDSDLSIQADALNQLQVDQNSLTTLVGTYDNRIVVNETDIDALESAILILGNDVSDQRAVTDQVEANDITQTADIAENKADIFEIQNTLGLTVTKVKLEQSGIAKGGDIVNLDFYWDVTLPIISISYQGGITYDPASLVAQEIIYGYGGLIALGNDQYAFNVTASLVEKAAPTIILTAWVPTNITVTFPVGSTALTTEAGVVTTTTACMGIRFKGTLSLSNSSEPGVAGRIMLQVAIDGGDWFTIDEFYAFLNEATGVWATKHIDVQLVLPQGSHTYNLRGRLITDYAVNDARVLNGSITVDEVIETGSGIVLSDDVYINWKAVENS